MKHIKPYVVALHLVALLVMTGCSDVTADQTSGETEPSAPRSAEFSTPNVVSSVSDMDELFPGDKAVSAAKYWQEHPDEAPEFLNAATLILDSEGVGAKTIELESADEGSAYVLVLTCDVASAYRVGLLDSKGTELSWTGGDSCGGPNLGTYTTPPLTTAPSLVVVDVSDGTKTALVVYAIQP